MLEYQALIWRSENDLGESVSPSTMRVQGNLTPGQWQLSVLTGPSHWCTVWFWRQGPTVVQDDLSWTGWLQPPSSWDCRHHYHTQIATWYFSQRSKRAVQHRERWRALCLVTGITLPQGSGVLFEFVLPVNNHCVSSLHQAEFSGADFSMCFCLYLLGDEFPTAEFNQPPIKESIRTQHMDCFLLTISQQSSTFVQCPSYRRC